MTSIDPIPPIENTAPPAPISFTVETAHSETPTSSFAKKFLGRTGLLIITTLTIGATLPLTVLVTQQSNDVRSRASEATPPPSAFGNYPTFSPSRAPSVSHCSEKCVNHGDCETGFFCNERGVCANALCPTSIDCVCR